MKHTILLVLLSLASMATRGQEPSTLQSWADRVKNFGTKLPQEQVFVHMDNTCYFLGDTIYYKAYVRRSDTGAPSKVSGVLYVDLLNQDGYLVQRQQLEMKNGQTHGSFALQDTLYGGYYELRAYTRWQLNWGRTTHPHTKLADRWFIHNGMADEYYTDYEKLYSRVFPVYDKPEEPGLFTHDMTLRPLRRQVKQSDKPLKAVVQLLPEGGNLVAGAPCRMAFEANDEAGLHLDGTLLITDGNGQKVDEAKTESRGRGSVQFTPQPGTKYKATFTWKDGTANVDMPKVEDDGVAMQVNQNDGMVTVSLSAQGSAAQEALGITIMTQGVVQHFEELTAGVSHTLTIDAATLPNGVAQLTVFNAEGRIWADRLFFIRQANFTASQLTFNGMEGKDVEAFAPVTLGVAGGMPGSTISMAVRDAAHSEYIYDTSNILTEMLLSSQILGFVEHPEYFFEADDAEHRRALDLLLMVQGWRRYDWHIMATPKAFALNHMPETTPFFTGEVRKYQTNGSEDYSREFTANLAMTERAEIHGKDAEAKKDGGQYVEHDVMEIQRSMDNANQQFKSSDNTYIDRVNDQMRYRGGLSREVLIHAEFTKPGAPEGIVGEMSTKEAQFSIQSPRFFEGCYFFLGASDSTKWKKGQDSDKHLWIQESRDQREELNYPEFYVRLKRYLPRFVKPYTWYQCHLAELPVAMKQSTEWLADGTRTLSELTVSGRRSLYTRFNAKAPAYVIDAYEAFNEACDLGLMPCIFEGGDRFTDAMARTYIGDMNMERRYDLERRYDTRNESSYIPQEEKKYYNHLERLDKVYIYTDYSPRLEGSKRFDQSNQPEVVIDLHLVPDNGRRPTFRDRRYVLPGFAVCEEFYQPNYAQKPLPETKDYRRTLYWNPNLTLDSEGRAEVTFYNNSSPTRLAISAEGMAPDGTPLTGRKMPEDEK